MAQHLWEEAAQHGEHPNLDRPVRHLVELDDGVGAPLLVDVVVVRVVDEGVEPRRLDRLRDPRCSDV